MNYRTLKDLVMIPSPSGEENKISNYINDFAKTISSTHCISDKKGNIYVSNSIINDELDYVFLVHMDQISITIISVDNEKAFFITTPILEDETLINQVFLFQNGEIGVVKKNLDEIFIDISGNQGIVVGMSAVLQPQYHQQGDFIYGTALDNKVGCMLGLNLIEHFHLYEKKICVVFTTQEEFDARGSIAVTECLDSKFIIGIDVTNTRECYERTSVEMGKGVAIKQRDGGIIVQHNIVEKLVTIACKRGIRSQIEIIDRGSTDVKWLNLLNSNIGTAALSIPCKYGHSSCEIVNQSDVDETLKLLKAICEGDL